jgi:hypothetical protein
MKNSKFYKRKPLKERIYNFFKSLIFWKGRKKGIIHTSNIGFKEIRAIFFPNSFHEKYRYLGSIPWNESGDIFKAMEPLVIFMDYKAKPRWCPRWFLRFLFLFGSDNSIVKVRNWTLHNFFRRLTKGIMLVDYKTKWYHYDLRISVHANDQINNLATDIELRFYERGLRAELLESIKKREPDFDGYYLPIAELTKYADELIEKEEREYHLKEMIKKDEKSGIYQKSNKSE